jgi:hypothetical protein
MHINLGLHERALGIKKATNIPKSALIVQTPILCTSRIHKLQIIRQTRMPTDPERHLLQMLFSNPTISIPTLLVF